MNRFLSPEGAALAPYTPGEQPQDRKYIKLNTNESPYPPSPRVLEALNAAETGCLNLYPDPACGALRRAAAARYGVSPENVTAGNGSDETLAFAFRAFCGTGRPVAFADVTYSFYVAQAALFGVEVHRVPLREDFTLRVEDYRDFPGTVVIANPNAPTGMAVPASEIRRLAEARPDRVVIVDEAYVDFGGESCVPLITACENLLVIRTFSKSRNLAGGRLSIAIGSPALIDGLNRVKYSLNPYSVNRLTLLAGTAALEDHGYFQQCVAAIGETRAWTAERLQAMGFQILPSCANFLFARHHPETDSAAVPGETLYRELKERGVLVRWFDAPRLRDWLRITIGSREQMTEFLRIMGGILDEQRQ